MYPSLSQVTFLQNHSCDPNCEIVACYINDADINKPLLAVFTIREVDPWEELCFSYYGDMEVSKVLFCQVITNSLLGKEGGARSAEGERRIDNA